MTLVQQQTAAWEEYCQKQELLKALVAAGDAKIEDALEAHRAYRKLCALLDESERADNEKPTIAAAHSAHAMLQGVLALGTFECAEQDDPAAHDATCTLIHQAFVTLDRVITGEAG
jgi:hypothetical protein